MCASPAAEKPGPHPPGPGRSRCPDPELSGPRTRVLQLQQPRQQHPGVSPLNVSTALQNVLCVYLYSGGAIHRVLVLTADYLSTLSNELHVPGIGHGADGGCDGVVWSSAVELRRGDNKGTMLKVSTTAVPHEQCLLVDKCESVSPGTNALFCRWQRACRA